MLNNLNFGTLGYICMKQAGNLNENEVSPATLQSYVNTKMYKIYRMLDGLDDPFYNRQMAMTVAADAQFIGTGITGGLSAVDSVGMTITRTDGVFVQGSIISVLIVNIATGAVVGRFTAFIVTGGATATFAVISGAAASLGAYAGWCFIQNSLSVSAIDVSGVYFKNFVAISDNMYTSVPGQMNRMFIQARDPNVFGNHDKDYLARKQVLWYQQGDKILLSIGQDANPLGSVVGEYRGKPALYSDATINNAIDIPPENNQILIDEVTSSLLIDRGRGGQIPQDLSGKLANYEKMYQAAEANKVKKMEIANK